MKRKFILPAAALLTVLILLFSFRPGTEDEVSFYYPRKEFLYGTADGVISSEVRDMIGHTDDLAYLIRMFLLTPTSDHLVSPFPQGTRLVSCEYTSNSIAITLSENGGPMSDIRFTLACACLAQTCRSIQPTEYVTIVRGSQSMTLPSSGVLLEADNSYFNGGNK